MSFAPAWGIAPERTRVTVAELLSQRAAAGGGSSPTIDAAPQTWPGVAGSSRRGLLLTIGAVLVTGSILYAATLEPPHSGNRTLGTESAEGGHPIGQSVAAPPPAVSARGRAPERGAGQPRRIPVEPAARSEYVPDRPSPPRPHRSAPVARDRHQVRDSDGSALSDLTPAIGPADSLLGTLGGR